MINPTAKQIQVILENRLARTMLLRANGNLFGKINSDSIEDIGQFLGTDEMLTTLCEQWFEEQGIEAPATITIETAEAILRVHNLSILFVMEITPNNEPCFNYSEPSDAYPGSTNRWLDTAVACQMFRQKNFIAMLKDRAHLNCRQIWYHMFSTTIPENCDSNINIAALSGNLPLFEKLTTYGRQRFNLWLSPLPNNWSDETYLGAVRSGNLQLVQFMEEKRSFYPDKKNTMHICWIIGKNEHD
jgi:hypothetical protein